MATTNPHLKNRMSSNANPAAAAPQQHQVAGGFGQHRERSFIRDNSRQNYQNYGAAAVRPRGQQQSAAAGRGKPSMEIYRPPSLRTGEVTPGVPLPVPNNSGNLTRVQFQVQANDDHIMPRLTKSKTSLELSPQTFSTARNVQQPLVYPAKVSRNAAASAAADAMSSFALQRSKSTGSHLDLSNKPAIPVNTSLSSGELPDLSQFSEEAQVILRKVAADPNKVSARNVIEAVRHVFSRLVESSRFASAAARYCIYVVEKETNETFLESVLNTCQEWYQERDRLLRTSANATQRWVAFINFLNEMYLQLKRRTTKLNTISPGLGVSRDLVLLSLLSDCCCVTLRPPSTYSLQELECLFFVLTGIGRDVEQELPSKMAAIMAAVRDAFLEVASLPAAAQRTLLQLVELRAAKWQLPATAVTYYYPSVSGTVY